MEEGYDLLDYINKVKAFADQFLCLEVSVRNENVIMTLLESVPPSYEYLIIVLEVILTKELTMEYVTTRFMLEVSKAEENKSHYNDAAMMLYQGKTNNLFWCKDL